MMGIKLGMAGVMAFFLLAVSAQIEAAQVTATLDRDRLVEGETVTLILQTDDAAQSLEGDLSLLRGDFNVLDQRSETRMSVINGEQTTVVRRLVTLEPKRAGRIPIPGLQFNGVRTSPLVLTVDPAPALAPGEMPPVFIEMALEPPSGPYYVHAQISLTVKIFYQQSLTEASITPPSPEQAAVRLLDEVPFPAERNGTRYRVLQRRYAIFPERSGTLVVPPMQLSGRLLERTGRSLWQSSGRGRRITKESEALEIEVLPKPASFSGTYWLPARDLKLSQRLSETSAVRVGEPVTRTVIVDAVGLEENMLEEPVWPQVPGVRIYPDQPQGISRDDGTWVSGHKEYRYAVVPEQPGELVLPELRVDWWDTVANRARTAILPEMRVPVLASDLPGITESRGAPAQTGTEVLSTNGTALQVQSAWRSVAIVLGLLWLLTLWLLLRSRSRLGASIVSDSPPRVPPAESELLARLEEACRGQNISTARALMGTWLRRYAPPEVGGSMSRCSGACGDSALEEALVALDTLGFKQADEAGWDGMMLWRAFSAWRIAQASVRKGLGPDVEPDLYAAGR